MRRLSPRLRDTRVLGVADQFLSSLQNFALTLLTARAVTAHEFGAFSIAILLYAVMIGLSQAGIGDAQLLTSHSLQEEDRHRSQLSAVLAGLGLGVALSLVLVLGAMVVPDDGVRQALLALALAMPALMGHDCGRFAWIAAGQAADALKADMVWVGAWIVVLVAARPQTPAHAVLAWGLTSAAGLVYTLWRLGGPWPWPAEVRRLIGEHAQLRSRLVGEYLAISAGGQLTVLGFSAAAGLTFGGGVRGAQSLLGPLNTLFNALRIVITPSLAKQYAEHGLRSLRMMLMLSGALIGIATVAGGALLLLPDNVGRALLGPTWTLTSTVLPIMVLHRILTSFAVGPLGTLRAAGLAGKLMVLRGTAELGGGVMCVVATVVGGPWWGLGLMLATPTMDAIVIWALVYRARKSEVRELEQPEKGIS